MLAVAAAYYVAGRVGLTLASVNASTTAVWPAAGIAVAALLLGGRRLWPAIAAAAFLVNLTTSGTIPASLAIATGNTLEALAAAWLLERFAGGTLAFDEAARAVRAAMLITLAAPVAATFGTVALVLSGLAAADAWPVVWVTWWLGDATGAILAAPLVLLWARPPRLDAIRARPLEAVAAVVSIAVVTLVVFSPLTIVGRGHYAVTWLCLPVLLWPAFRFGPRECAVAAAVLAVIAIRYTVPGFGPFALPEQNTSLLLLQLFLAAMMIVSIATGAVASARRRREAELASLNDELERRVVLRTADLQQVRARLSEAQHVAHVGSWEWDITADRVWWSDEMYRIYGLDEASLPASFQSFLEYIHPDDVTKVQQEVGAAIDSRLPWTFEHRIVRPDGQVRTILASGDTVKGEADQPLRLRGTAQDVTERRRAEEERAALAREHAARVEAEEANRLKDQFIATLSHELRTPLNAVMGWAHMLINGTLDEPGRERALEMIYRNAIIQSQLVSDMLDVSRITAGTMVLNISMVDLPSVVLASMETAAPAAQAKQITIEPSLDETAWVDGDAKRLAQVVNNLLTNAVKFTPVEGRIMVSLAKNEHDVKLTIEDTGPGIPPEFLAHVFERFRQADASVTRAHGGLGLGLSIVRHIVELHGGTVEAGNRPDGSGALFTVRLPRHVPTTPDEV